MADGRLRASDQIMVGGRRWGSGCGLTTLPTTCPPPLTSSLVPFCHHYKMASVPLFAASTETASYVGEFNSKKFSFFCSVSKYSISHTFGNNIPTVFLVLEYQREALGLPVRVYLRGIQVSKMTQFDARAVRTPRKHAFLPCGHLDFESAVTAQIDEFKAVLIARIHAR